MYIWLNLIASCSISNEYIYTTKNLMILLNGLKFNYMYIAHAKFNYVSVSYHLGLMHECKNSIKLNNI